MSYYEKTEVYDLSGSIGSSFHILDGINHLYTGTNKSSSAWYRCKEYRQATLGYEINKTTAPTDILFEVEMDLGDGNARKLTNWFLGDLRYDDLAVGTTGLDECVTFPIAGSGIRVSVTCTGTNPGDPDKFSVSGAYIYLRN